MRRNRGVDAGAEMSVEAYVKLHIECSFRNEQKSGDDFELYLGDHQDPFWLNRAEVEQLIERAKAALGVYEYANAMLANEAEDDSLGEP